MSKRKELQTALKQLLDAEKSLEECRALLRDAEQNAQNSRETLIKLVRPLGAKKPILVGDHVLMYRDMARVGGVLDVLPVLDSENLEDV